MTEPLSWQPARRVYLRHAVILGVFTFALFLGAAALSRDIFAPSPLVIVLVPTAMTAIFVIEDFSRWRRVRAEHWEIENGYLVHDSMDGRVMLPLEEIAGVAKRFTGSVVLTLASGQRVPMRFLENPDNVAARLNDLVQNPLVQDAN